MSLFIVLEGGEGAGKSTLAAGLSQALAGRGYRVIVAREPGGTPGGEAVRTVLQQELTPWAETFLFLAARAELVERVIRPALDAGTIVICDRFAASTFAYQGYGRGLALDALHSVNDVATGHLTPEVTIFLDIDPAEGMARKRGETDVVRTGTEALVFHQRVREGYLAQANSSWLRLDARDAPERILEAALARILPLLPAVPPTER